VGLMEREPFFIPGGLFKLFWFIVFAIACHYWARFVWGLVF